MSESHEAECPVGQVRYSLRCYPDDKRAVRFCQIENNGMIVGQVGQSGSDGYLVKTTPVEALAS